MNVDWAAYGNEDSGHALLGATGDVSVASELTQFTDRPGNPPEGQQWGPVTSGFPFKGFYVVLRTMPDVQANRLGMVRSYAAFIPLNDLGEINSLAEIVSAMPSASDFQIGREMNPLRISGGPPVLVPTNSEEFVKTIMGLCAPKSEQPVVWALKKDYLPTLDTIWSKIPDALRRTFSFGFQFSSDHPYPVPSAFIATDPGFANRWSCKWIVDGTPLRPEVKSGIIEWFRSNSKVVDLEEVVSSYGLNLQTFQELRLLEQFFVLINLRTGLDFDELTRAVRILEKFSNHGEKSKKKARAALFFKLCEAMPTVSSEEISTLRNLRPHALPDLIEPAKLALGKWLSNAESSEKEDGIVEVIEIAVDAPNNWWSQPFVEWITKVASEPTPKNGKRLLKYVLRSQKASTFVLEKVRFNNPKWEEVLLNLLPTALTETSRPNVIALSMSQKWHRICAYCVSKIADRRLALSIYEDSSNGSHAGYAILAREWGLLGLVEAADERGDLRAFAFLSAEIGSHFEQLTETVVVRLKNPALLFPGALAVETAPLDAGIRELMSLLINRDFNVEIIKAALRRDASILLGLKAPVSALAVMDKAGQSQVRKAFSDVVAAGLLDQCVFSDSGEESWLPIVDFDLVAAKLADDPFVDEGMAAIVAFTAFDDLTDEHFCRWLSEFFRVGHENGIGVGEVTKNSLIVFLLRRDFPKSAQIVKETVEQFHRGDVWPILEAIRGKYQDLGPASVAKTKSMNKLPIIFVATALPLECEAVKAHLSNVVYDPHLQLDHGVWPSVEDPLVEVYLAITGAGNLSSQAAAISAFYQKKPQGAFFLGVGGGIKDRSIGDVVYGEKVHYIEAGKENKDGDYASRPDGVKTNKKLINLTHRIASDAARANKGKGLGFAVAPAVIVSGEKVLASNLDKATFFNIVRRNFNDGQVIEMEGFGFMSAARDFQIEYSMILRGISDLCMGKDAEKDKESQPRAAKNAAEFLFRMLPEYLELILPKSRWKKIKDSVATMLKGRS